MNRIEVKSVKKNFRLPHNKSNSVKGLALSVFSFKKKTFEVQHALRGVSFNVADGEFFGIVGRNGSGKSTLLKLLAEIYQPTSGTVAVNGRLVPFIELGVGFNPELTGRENVYLNGALLGFSKKQMQAMYDDIVEFAELSNFMDQKLKNYSSGMQVRLAFSLAIRADSDILLIDEVLAVGDADFQRKCFDYFKSLKRNGKTVVFVSHDMNAVREYCDRALLISEGVVKQVGTAEEIAEEYIKLFANTNTQVDSSKKDDGSRWGNKRVEIANLSVDVRQQEIKLELTVRANEKVEDFIAGFLLKDPSGKPLFGTNTKLLHKKTGIINKGETKKISWTTDNILSSGKHLLTVALTESDEVDVCDWWNDAVEINVSNEDSTAYSISPKFKLTIS